ncbi:ClbS/DfsB family four-helix bundle protein [Criblamydia sequanensis]|uniref:ClbS/DfsB family four-helix bundle protein n=1 Tax=Candidatus Criblamydia sequanensis CRIB-18 TaxID=1437425 RepID=A0A090D2K7_9BACT|nr:ClbS/DfsB family four-helix bundle protein [Criblamydia sequanensis]CDR34453.1 hypothetical protein CSEC_1640 [Criblamydia sequanensis CRIB-18]
MQSTLIQDILHESDRLVKIITSIPPSDRHLKVIEGTGGKVSAADLLAYQIGWGKNLIRWYEEGVKGKDPEMPGNGFTTWDYVAIAKDFYQKYASNDQIKVFKQTVSRIIEIIQIEEPTGQLDQIGVWEWCTLVSGKKWPLRKWIQVNTVAPYKRAIQLIKKSGLT